MDETPPNPLPLPAGAEPPAPLPPIAPPEEIPFATVATPAIPEADIPFAQANAPTFTFTGGVARRPGMVTAIGVLAIVVAALSALVSLTGGAETFAVYGFSKIAGAVRNGNMGTQPVQNATPAAQTNPMSIADSGMVTTVLQDLINLDGARLREATTLLHKHGSAIFQTSENSALTAADVRTAITESYKATGGSDAARFVTAQGSVDIYPDHATFVSMDGATTIDTSALKLSDSVVTNSSASMSMTVNTSASPATMPSGVLQPGEISRAIAQIRMQPNVQVTPEQIAAIRRELSNPNQLYIVPNSTTLVYFASNLQPSNELQITFSSGSLTLDTAGKVTNTNTFASQPFGMKFSVPGNWTAVVVGECIASILLAIYLLVTGIMTLRGSLYAPRLLRIFAVLKILLTIVAAVGVINLITGIVSGNTAVANSPNAVAAAMTGVFVFLAGAAFPVGLLIALRTDGVRNYFAASETSRV